MSRVQVLDVGDRVKTTTGGYAYSGREGVIFKENPHFPGSYLVAVEHWDGRRAADIDLGWRRDELLRIGGDLQVGDFVRVNGEVEPTRTSDAEELVNLEC